MQILFIKGTGGGPGLAGIAVDSVVVVVVVVSHRYSTETPPHVVSCSWLPTPHVCVHPNFTTRPRRIFYDFWFSLRVDWFLETSKTLTSLTWRGRYCSIAMSLLQSAVGWLRSFSIDMLKSSVVGNRIDRPSELDSIRADPLIPI